MPPTPTAPIPLSPELRALAPVFAARFTRIVACIVAVIAREFLRNPSLAPLIVPLCGRLSRGARHLTSLMARLASHGACRRRRDQSEAGRASRHRPRVYPPKPPIPTNHGWLVAILNSDVAPYGSQLAHLLSEPGMSDLLDAAPTARRFIRPILHMLGIPRRAAKRSGKGSDRGFSFQKPRERSSPEPPKAPPPPPPAAAPWPPLRTLGVPTCERMALRWPWVRKPHEIPS